MTSTSPSRSLGLGPFSPWAEIFGAGLWAPVPAIRFGSVQVPATEVCVDGDVLRTRRPVTFCAEVSSEGSCTAWGEAPLETPRHLPFACASSGAEHATCSLDDDGRAGAPVPEVIPVPVYAAPEGSDSAVEPLFEKALTLPTCA